LFTFREGFDDMPRKWEARLARRTGVLPLLLLAMLVAVWSVAGCSCEPSPHVAQPTTDNGSGTDSDAVTEDGWETDDGGPDALPPEEVRPTAPIPIPPAPPEPVYEPQVWMTEAHAATCLVKVGDAMPDITLPDLEGNEQLLARLYGEKLTVVVFWNSHYALAREQFMRLERETADRFSAFGVSVVAINVSDTPQEVRSVATEADSGVPCLLDQQGAALALVATEKLPRTYVLDSAGRILWLDIEYSLSTARELRNAVYYFLRRPGDGAAPDPLGG
jgi:peroxiredoxin